VKRTTWKGYTVTTNSKIDRHLARFVRRECANYDAHHRLCSNDQPCRVLNGEPCSYFERVVLGPPDYSYKLPGYDYRRLFNAYGRINTKLAGRAVVIRTCACGAVLQPRERVCEKCREQRRRATYRQAQQKRRLAG